MATTGHESEAINVQGLKASLQKLKTEYLDGSAYLEDGDSSSVIADFDPQADTLWKKAQVLSAAERAQVQQNIGVREWLNNLTGEKFVSVTATAQTSDVTTLLPASGAVDTIYRVGMWDGSAYNQEYYSDYAWDGTAYVQLNKKSIVGEVFDISEYNAGASYASLSAALGVDGVNVPVSVRKGGMSVKYVSNSDNKYVQFRLMSDTFNTTPANWQGIDDEPTAESNNLVKSGGIKGGLNKKVSGINCTTNLVLFESMLDGYRCDNGTGALVADADFTVSDWIVITPSTSYFKSGILYEFDENKTLIRYVVYTDYNFITSANAAFARLVIGIANKGIAQVSLGSTTIPYQRGMLGVDKSQVIGLGEIENNVSKNSDDIKLNVIRAKESSNIINKFDVIKGYLINNSGVESVAADWWHTKLIPVTPSTSISWYRASNMHRYDANGNWLGVETANVNFNLDSNTHFVIFNGILSNLDIAQANIGSTILPYEVGGNLLDKEQIIGLSDVVLKEDTVLPENYTGNIIIKKAIIDGYYLNTVGQRAAAAGWWCTPLIPAKPNTQYSQYQTNACCQYDKNLQFIENTRLNTNPFTTTADTAYIAFTGTDAMKNTAQANEGSTLNPYESGKLQYLSSDIRGYKYVLEVDKENGEFKTIMAAVNQAKTIYGRNTPVAIIINPGIYVEQVDIVDTKIALIGICRELCIIRDDSGIYETPPLEISGGNVIENLTIIATHDDMDPEYTGTKSYGIHADWDYEGEMHIRNCKIISYQAAACGFGSHNNQQITFERCDMYSSVTVALLYHNKVGAGALNQKLIVDNCRLKSDAGVALSLQDVNNTGDWGGAGDNRDTSLSFYYTTLLAINSGDAAISASESLDSEDSKAVGWMHFTKDSYGNNAPRLNA